MNKNWLKIGKIFFLAFIMAMILLPSGNTLATDTNAGNIYQDINSELQPIRNIYGPAGGNPNSLARTIAGIIRIVLGFLGIIFIVLTIYAGFMWMTAAGNDDKIATAKKTLVAAVIGLAIVLSSYAFTRFVLSRLLDAAGVPGANAI